MNDSGLNGSNIIAFSLVMPIQAGISKMYICHMIEIAFNFAYEIYLTFFMIFISRIKKKTGFWKSTSWDIYCIMFYF